MKKNSTVWDRKGEYFVRQSIDKVVDNHRLLWLLNRYIYQNKDGFSNFLEIGCSAGGLYNMLKDIYGRDIEDKYHGIDISVNNLHFAHLLYPEAWFKWGDVRSYVFKQNYDIIYSSEVLPHIEMKYIKKIIKDLILHSKDLCLFSMKFTELESFEFKFPTKELIGYYTYLNIDEILKFIHRFTNGRIVNYYKIYGSKWFVNDKKSIFHKHYKKSGSLIVEIIGG